MADRPVPPPPRKPANLVTTPDLRGYDSMSSSSSADLQKAPAPPPPRKPPNLTPLSPNMPSAYDLLPDTAQAASLQAQLNDTLGPKRGASVKLPNFMKRASILPSPVAGRPISTFISVNSPPPTASAPAHTASSQFEQALAQGNLTPDQLREMSLLELRSTLERMRDATSYIAQTLFNQPNVKANLQPDVYEDSLAPLFNECVLLYDEMAKAAQQPTVANAFRSLAKLVEINHKVDERNSPAYQLHKFAALVVYMRVHSIGELISRLCPAETAAAIAAINGTAMQQIYHEVTKRLTDLKELMVRILNATSPADRADMQASLAKYDTMTRSNNMLAGAFEATPRLLDRYFFAPSRRQLYSVKGIVQPLSVSFPAAADVTSLKWAPNSALLLLFNDCLVITFVDDTDPENKKFFYNPEIQKIIYYDQVVLTQEKKSYRCQLWGTKHESRIEIGTTSVDLTLELYGEVKTVIDWYHTRHQRERLVDFSVSYKAPVVSDPKMPPFEPQACVMTLLADIHHVPAGWHPHYVVGTKTGISVLEVARGAVQPQHDRWREITSFAKRPTRDFVFFDASSSEFIATADDVTTTMTSITAFHGASLRLEKAPMFMLTALGSEYVTSFRRQADTKGDAIKDIISMDAVLFGTQHDPTNQQLAMISICTESHMTIYDVFNTPVAPRLTQRCRTLTMTKKTGVPTYTFGAHRLLKLKSVGNIYDAVTAASAVLDKKTRHVFVVFLMNLDNPAPLTEHCFEVDAVKDIIDYNAALDNNWTMSYSPAVDVIRLPNGCVLLCYEDFGIVMDPAYKLYSHRPIFWSGTSSNTPSTGFAISEDNSMIFITTSKYIEVRRTDVLTKIHQIIPIKGAVVSRRHGIGSLPTIAANYEAITELRLAPFDAPF